MKQWLKAHKALIMGSMVIMLGLWWGCQEAKAAETLVEIGTTHIANEFEITGGMATLTERFNGRYDLTGGFVTEQRFEFCDRPDCYWKVRQQLFVGAELLFTSPNKNWILGTGPYWFQNPSRVVNSNFRWGIHIEWWPDFMPENMYFAIRHFSSGGSAQYRCQQRQYDDPTFGEFCGDWNTGLDSLFRIGFKIR